MSEGIQSPAPRAASRQPDRWVVVRLSEGSHLVRKVLAGWYGGYLSGDSWRLSSGIAGERELPDRWEFSGATGSTYVCMKGKYGLSSCMADVLSGWQEKTSSSQSLELDEKYQPE